MSSTVSTTSRIIGIASGLDTESVVNDMLSASRAKLDKVKQQKILLEWKQEAYKSITSKLYDFQAKYFGSSGSVFSSSLTKLSAACGSPYVSVSPGTTQGNIYISDIVSLASAASLESSSRVSADPTISVSAENLSGLAGKSLRVTLDGDEKTITFSDRTYSSTADVASELSSLLSSAFGEGRINLSLDGDSVTLSAENSTLMLALPYSSEANPAGILDFDGFALNRIDFALPLSEAGLALSPLSTEEDIAFTINGVSFSFSSDTSLGAIINEINSSPAGVKISYSMLTDKFTLTSTQTGSASSISVQDNLGSLMSTLFGAGVYKAGTDAVVKLSVNGSTDESDLVTVTRSTNSFEVNGSVIKLLGKAAGDARENISINLAYDTEAIVEKVSAFINDYNELLGSINKLLSEESYRDYPPLTDDEKKALTDEEIKLWTEKAKSGILRNDTYLSAIAAELRGSIYTAIEGLGSISSIGIATGLYSEKGKLYLDKDKLREALSKDTEGSLKFFTRESRYSYSLYAPESQQKTRFSENGILSRLSDIIKKNLSTVGKKGALIMLVGSPDSLYNSETEYAKRLKSIQEKIDRMEDKLIDEEERYWRQFTAMESALSKLYSQSSYLSNLFSSNK